MNFTNPFSGLSLIIHLLIIVLSPVVSLLLPKKFAVATGNKTARSVTSVATVLAVAFIVVFSTVVAIRTGIREGNHKLHASAVRLFESHASVAQAEAPPAGAAVVPAEALAPLPVFAPQNGLPLAALRTPNTLPISR